MIDGVRRPYFYLVPGTLDEYLATVGERCFIQSSLSSFIFEFVKKQPKLEVWLGVIFVKRLPRYRFARNDTA